MATSYKNPPSSITMYGVSFYLSDSEKLESLNLSCEICQQQQRRGVIKECTYISKGHIIAFHVNCIAESTDQKYSYTTTGAPTQTQTGSMQKIQNPPSSVSMHGVSFYLSDSEKQESLNLKCEICYKKSRGVKEWTYISKGHIIAFHVKCSKESTDHKYSYNTTTFALPKTQTPASGSVRGNTQIIENGRDNIIEHEKRFKKRKLLFSVAAHLTASALGVDGPWDILADLVNNIIWD